MHILFKKLDQSADKSLMRLTYHSLLNSLLWLTSSMLTGCTNINPSPSAFQEVDKSESGLKLEASTSGGNGGSYDGKILRFESRIKHWCQGKEVPLRRLIKNQITGLWYLQQSINDGLRCQYSEESPIFTAFGFEYSQVAVLDQELFDLIPDQNISLLPNESLAGVCRIVDESKPFRVADSNFYGMVLLWNSVMGAYSTRFDYDWNINGQKSYSIGPNVLILQEEGQIKVSSSAYDQELSQKLNLPVLAVKQRQQIEILIDQKIHIDGFFHIHFGIMNYSFKVYNSVPPYLISNQELFCFFKR